MHEIVWHIKSFDELSTHELYEILKKRQEVFIVEQECYYLDADGYDAQALHLWGEREGEIVAYCRIFRAGIKYAEPSIGRVITSTAYRGKGLGKALMKIALDAMETHFGTTQVRISAQDYLIPFYIGFGFTDTGKKYMEDFIPHTEMVRG